MSSLVERYNISSIETKVGTISVATRVEETIAGTTATIDGLFGSVEMFKRKPESGVPIITKGGEHNKLVLRADEPKDEGTFTVASIERSLDGWKFSRATDRLDNGQKGTSEEEIRFENGVLTMTGYDHDLLAGFVHPDGPLSFSSENPTDHEEIKQTLGRLGVKLGHYRTHHSDGILDVEEHFGVNTVPYLFKGNRYIAIQPKSS